MLPRVTLDGFRTARQTLRVLRPEDRALVRAAFADNWDAWAPWMPALPPGGTERVADLAVDRAVDGAESGTQLRLGAFLPDGSLVGLFNLNDIVRGMFEGGVASWVVVRRLEGLGHASEGVRALLDIAFAAAPSGLGLHRVQAGILPENTRSLALAERMGMRREGLALRYLRIAGEWRDHALYAKLVEEHRFRSPNVYGSDHVR